MITQLNDIAQIWWQWMAGMFWQVSLLIILVTALDMAIRRWAWPQVRYVLWILVFLKLVIPPTWQMPTSIVSWLQPKFEEQISVRIETRELVVEEIQLSASGVSAQKQDKGPAEKASWKAIVFLTWIAGIIAFAMMLTIKISRLPKRSKTLENSDTPEWFRELLEKTSDRLNLKKVPAVVFSRDLKSPAVYGLFKPVLLLPEGCLDELTEEQAEHVLIHELCHLKRGDLLVHWFCLILQIIYWFNPLLIWTRRQMRQVCEICCDLSVAEILREKTTAYRNTLLETARELLTESVEPSLGLLGIFEEPFRLVSRLKWLEKKTWGNNKQKIAVTIITSLIMIICVMPMAGISQTNLKNNNSEIQSNDHVKADRQDTQDKDNTLKPQIFIEAVLVEVDEEAASGFGIELKQAPSEDRIQTGGAAFAVIPDNGITIGGKSFTDIKAAIEAMKTEPGIHILSTPRIMTLENLKATIESGTTTLESPSVNESPQKRYEDILSLEITSQIQEDGYIHQEIDLEHSYQTGEESQGNGTITRNIKNTIKVRDGETVVIGNIRTPEDAIAEEDSSDRKELMMFLTTRIINSKEESDNIYQGVIRGTDGQQTEDRGSFKVTENSIGSGSPVRRMDDMPDDYMRGVEYESGVSSITNYDALILEVDADKELGLDAETIGQSPGSQMEENEHYAVRMEFNSGTQPDEKDLYDIERVEVIRRSQGKFGPRLPDLPTDDYDNVSEMRTVINETFTSPLSVSRFKDVISIRGETFPDIEAVFERMKKEAGVNILVTPQTITLEDEKIETSWNDRSSTVLLGINSGVTNGGGVQNLVSLNISPSVNEVVKGLFSPNMDVLCKLSTIEGGGTMVMIYDPGILADRMNEEYTTPGKKLYVFLSPHVENPL